MLLAPREPQVVEVTRKLLEYILYGELQPGARIPSERKLAEALGIGRSSVREAIKSLSLLGLLDVRQGDGTFLSASGSSLLPAVIDWGLLLGQRHLADLMEARTEIEVLGAGYAAERATSDQVAEIRRLLEVMRRASDDIRLYIDADAAFHLEIAKASGNEVFANVIMSLRSLLRAWIARTLEYAQQTRTSFAMHEPICLAIEGADKEGARRAMRVHMEIASKKLLAAIERPGGPRLSV